MDTLVAAPPVRTVRPAGRSSAPAAWFRLARPWFWPVSLLPWYLGFLLASHRLLPAADRLPAFVAGALVTGPLLWVAVLAVNDVHDVAGDRLNPRRTASPLVTGRISVPAARRTWCVSATAAVLVALVVGVPFALGTLGAAALGYWYSAPPVRLKGRPGLDLAVNALAIGVLAPLAGWITVAPPGGFPWVMAVQGTLIGAALYLPTTLLDRTADAAGGYRTIAVRLGFRRTYRLGLACWVAAALLSVVLSAADDVIPRALLPMEVVAVPVLVAAYHRLLARRPSFRGLVLVSLLFLVPSAVFALHYAGLV